MAVLIDSSVWIAASKRNSKEAETLTKMIRGNESIFVARPIQVEVCQGARTEELFHNLWESFLGFEFLEINTRIWGISAWNYFRCRKKGRTVATIDCLIGTLSAEYGVPLWTLDKSLRTLDGVIGFDSYRV